MYDTGNLLTQFRMSRIITFICKKFPEIIEAAYKGLDYPLEANYVALEGAVVPDSQGGSDIFLSPESLEKVRLLAAAGYTVTAFISHDIVLVPFDLPLFEVVDSINAQNWGRFKGEGILP